MWAWLALTLALAVRVSETNNDTAVEEKLVIARGKLLVSTIQNPSNLDTWISSCHVHKMFGILLSQHGDKRKTKQLQKSEIKYTLDKRTGDTVIAFNKQRGN